MEGGAATAVPRSAAIVTVAFFSAEVAAIVSVFAFYGWLEFLVALVFFLHLWTQAVTLGRLVTVVEALDFGRLAAIVEIFRRGLEQLSEAKLSASQDHSSFSGRDKTLN